MVLRPFSVLLPAALATAFALGAITTAANAQELTALYSFGGGTDGGHPVAGVIFDASSNLYGTTTGDNVSNFGTVFVLDQAGNETVLHNFTGVGEDGSSPNAGLVRDGAGNLYGTTLCGGVHGGGVVFKLDSSGHQTILHSFPAFAGDGGSPRAGLIRDSAGNLFGTTYTGGRAGLGTVFTLNRAGVETILHNFTGGPDGQLPLAGLVRDKAGNLYGTTYGGGSANDGTVFEIDKAGRDMVLYSFPGGASGKYPQATLVRDAAGNLYGTTYGGGTFNSGTVFVLNTTGREVVLHSFSGGADGALPQAGLVRDAAGNLYGTTPTGSAFGEGTVFQLRGRNFTVLYRFTGLADGAEPLGELVRDPAGNLYGTSNGGGAFGWGTVFKLSH